MKITIEFSNGLKVTIELQGDSEERLEALLKLVASLNPLTTADAQALKDVQQQTLSVQKQAEGINTDPPPQP